MTPRTLSSLFLSLSSLEFILGASFSNVLVKSGTDVIPLEYINYGSGPLPFSPQIAQISASPLETVVPISSVSNVVSPCVSPCVIPNVPVAGVPSNARIVTYKSPIANLPVVLANKDETRGYQYAYAVYDDYTGDKKTQSEQSDGSMVQGQYSFIQPDGVRREVSYTADDLKGFNAVIRNIAPQIEISKDETTTITKEDKTETLPPCNEVKSEQLSEQIKPEGSQDGGSIIENVELNEINADDKAPEASSTTDLTWNGDIPTNAVISYTDIINCIQAKLQTVNTQQSNVSPLTFILLPSLLKPC